MADMTLNICTMRNAIKGLADRAISTCNEAELEWLTGLGELATVTAADLSDVLEAITVADYNEDIGHPWESLERFKSLTTHLAINVEMIATMGELAMKARGEQKSRAYEAGKPRKSSRARSVEESSQEATHE